MLPRAPSCWSIADVELARLDPRSRDRGVRARTWALPRGEVGGGVRPPVLPRVGKPALELPPRRDRVRPLVAPDRRLRPDGVEGGRDRVRPRGRERGGGGR